MPGTIPNPVLLYRIIDYQNLSFILQNGIYCPNSPISNPNYIGIGKNDIIQKRTAKLITVNPFGAIHDYVPFYFAPRSPMLYSIIKGNTGYQGKQEDIIYLVTSVEKIEEGGLQYVFTDGHSIMILSRFFNQKSDLKEVDWDVMNSSFWNDDPPVIVDRKRKRMAELLVLNQVPVKNILGVAVMNENMYNIVTKIIANYQVKLPVRIRKDWYY